MGWGMVFTREKVFNDVTFNRLRASKIQIVLPSAALYPTPFQKLQIYDDDDV